jgi:hypothetical protein
MSATLQFTSITRVGKPFAGKNSRKSQEVFEKVLGLGGGFVVGGQDLWL